jgi:hypothetical protein
MPAPRLYALLAGAVVGVCWLLVAVASALRAFNQSAALRRGFPARQPSQQCTPLWGPLLAWLRPRNRIGWLLCVVGLLEALELAGGEYAHGPTTVPVAA